MKAFVTTIIIIVGAMAWFFVSPLLLDDEVNEALPGFDALPTRAEVDAMSDDDKAALQAQMVALTATAADRVMRDAMPEALTRLARGVFTDADAVHKGSGNAFIYRLADDESIVRFEDFRVTNGPALVVLLSKASDPRTAADVIDAGYVSLGKLKGNVGNQNYSVPDNVVLSDYQSVIIWCELFDVLFSAAPLSVAT